MTIINSYAVKPVSTIPDLIKKVLKVYSRVYPSMFVMVLIDIPLLTQQEMAVDLSLCTLNIGVSISKLL